MLCELNSDSVKVGRLGTSMTVFHDRAIKLAIQCDTKMNSVKLISRKFYFLIGYPFDNGFERARDMKNIDKKIQIGACYYARPLICFLHKR